MLGRLALQWLTQGVAVAVNRQLRPPLRDQVVLLCLGCEGIGLCLSLELRH